MKFSFQCLSSHFCGVLETELPSLNGESNDSILASAFACISLVSAWQIQNIHTNKIVGEPLILQLWTRVLGEGRRGQVAAATYTPAPTWDWGCSHSYCLPLCTHRCPCTLPSPWSVPLPPPLCLLSTSRLCP